MNTIFAHAGHSHDTSNMTGLDHCAPIIIIAGIIIVILAGIIVYLMANTQPKVSAKSSKKTKK